MQNSRPTVSTLLDHDVFATPTNTAGHSRHQVNGPTVFFVIANLRANNRQRSKKSSWLTALCFVFLFHVDLTWTEAKTIQQQVKQVRPTEQWDRYRTLKRFEPGCKGHIGIHDLPDLPGQVARDAEAEIEDRAAHIISGPVELSK